MKPGQARAVMRNGHHYQDGIRVKRRLEIVREPKPEEPEREPAFTVAVECGTWQVFSAYDLPNSITRRLPMDFSNTGAAYRWVTFLNGKR